jgi:hypothetical protein
MNLITMHAHPSDTLNAEEAFKARLAMLQPLESAVTVAMRELERTDTTVTMAFHYPTSQSEFELPSDKTLAHWFVTYFGRTGRVRHAMLRQDRQLVQLATSYKMPMGWTVPLDLGELSIEECRAVIKALHAIGGVTG